MKNNAKKFIFLPVLAAASLGMSTLALADNGTNNNTTYAAPTPGGNPVETAAIISAIKDIGNKMVALGFAGMSAFDQAMYQYDKNLLNTLNANTAGLTVAQNTPTAGTQTNNYIQQSFQAIPNGMLSTAEGAINASKVTNEIKAQNALVNNLTLGVPASDSLYINNPLAMVGAYNTTYALQNFYNSSTAYTVGPTTINDDSYFNISSITSPNAYTSTQQTAANTYMAYLTQSYNSAAGSLDLADLKSYLNSLPAPSQPQALYNFVSSSQYQNYQLTMRSMMANKSIAINNFESLIAERTPSKTAVQGITTPDGQTTIAKPSPLQVEQYQALHRVDNPAWIESLQNQSSTTLQREIAVELAQIIKQNYQAHLDREHILTTMSALQLSSSQASTMAMNTLAQQVNDEIKGLGKSGSKSSNGQTSQQAKNQADKASQKQSEAQAKAEAKARAEAKKNKDKS